MSWQIGRICALLIVTWTLFSQVMSVLGISGGVVTAGHCIGTGFSIWAFWIFYRAVPNPPPNGGRHEGQDQARGAEAPEDSR